LEERRPWLLLGPLLVAALAAGDLEAHGRLVEREEVDLVRVRVRVRVRVKVRVSVRVRVRVRVRVTG